MTLDTAAIRDQMEAIKTEGIKFFNDLLHMEEDTDYWDISDADHYWSRLEEASQKTSIELQSNLIQSTKAIANSMKYSTLLTEADSRDLGAWTKSVRASLRLRRYYYWDAEVLHDEGEVLGLRRAGQSDTTPVHPEKASSIFERDIINLLRLVDLLDIPSVLSTEEWRANPQATAEYEPGTAFVMMQINPERPEIEDRYNAIKESFAQFGVNAVRADEIEHEDLITKKIIERIRVSEFLIADLTGERPSVYYEIGYAHALNRRVIMYRKKDVRLHFDLASYNCPEYTNVTDLKRKLMNRLEQITNRKPKSAGT